MISIFTSLCCTIVAETIRQIKIDADVLIIIKLIIEIIFLLLENLLLENLLLEIYYSSIT